MRGSLFLCAVLLGLVLAPAAVLAADLAPDLRVGGDLRLRGEAFDNVLDLTESRHDSYEYYRFRPRLWLDARPREALRFYLRLGNEYRWGRGPGMAGVRDPEGKITLDNGWAEWGRATGPALKFGRMDLQYGEGFLIFDGTAADGSSSSYFDAIVLSWRAPRGGVDLLTAKIDDQAFGTAARDEDLYGIYATFGPEAYVLHREKRGSTATSSGVVSPKRSITAVGGRVKHLPDAGWRGAVEAAWQFGDFNEHGAGAYGGLARGGWAGAGRWKPACEAGGVYLSGDDPGTSRIEGWDPFYSDWPKYSEALIYTLYDNTTRVPGDDSGTWTNLSGAWLEARAAVAKQATVSLRGSWFGAPQRTGAGGGRTRGALLAGQLNVAFAPDVQGQLLAEYFDPGDFYTSGADPAWYGRWQMTARF